MSPVPSPRDVSRLEGFSDAVFGFALTLLVVSLEVPRDFGGLSRTLGGFLSFAATFATIVWIWYEHYLVFRKFRLEDGITIALNAALLFVVLFYVYPLKFVFSNLIPQVTPEGLRLVAAGFAGMTAGEARQLLAVYSLGFVAIFALFAALYGNARRQRVTLGLDALGLHDATAGMRRHGVSVAIGLLSVILAVTLPDRWVGLSGFCYLLLGPAHAVYGYRSGLARERLAAALAGCYHPPEESTP
jgi:hypothetical protein